MSWGPAMSDKKARIADYRKWIQESLGSEAWGYAEAEIVYDGVTYRIGQAASTAYDALDALATSVKFMQKELGVSGVQVTTSGGTPLSIKIKTPLTSSGEASTSTPVADAGVMPVETIKLGAGGENPYWIVKGGSWKKHGVICWPEVLEQAGLLKGLDPFKENRPGGGWQARYIKKENGNPDKVVQFVSG